jgi:hypothetical protein
MKERNITVTLEKAREYYKSDNESLKDIALQAFSKEELNTFDFTKIKTFKDACNTLNIDCKVVNYLVRVMAGISKASVAMFKLNIIRKALNLDQDLHLTKGPYVYFPCNPFVTEKSHYYRKELNSGEMVVIGKIKSEGTLYNVLGGCADMGSATGLGDFTPGGDVGDAIAGLGFLGCATEEIAQHFGKCFGMLITEAKYADMVDFEILS